MFAMSASADLRPSTKLTTIGKNEMRTTTITFEVISGPTHTSRSGASVMIGIVCDAMTIG